jgi:hypothetical protein
MESGEATKKPKVPLGFDSICRLLADAGFSLPMGDTGRDECGKHQ